MRLQLAAMVNLEPNQTTTTYKSLQRQRTIASRDHGSKSTSSRSSSSSSRKRNSSVVGASRDGGGGGGGIELARVKGVLRRGRQRRNAWRKEGDTAHDVGKVPSNPRGWPNNSEQKDVDARPQRVIMVNEEQEYLFCSNFVRTSKVKNFVGLFSVRRKCARFTASFMYWRQLRHLQNILHKAVRV